MRQIFILAHVMRSCVAVGLARSRDTRHFDIPIRNVYFPLINGPKCARIFTHFVCGMCVNGHGARMRIKFYDMTMEWPSNTITSELRRVWPCCAKRVPYQYCIAGLIDSMRRPSPSPTLTTIMMMVLSSTTRARPSFVLKNKASSDRRFRQRVQVPSNVEFG